MDIVEAIAIAVGGDECLERDGFISDSASSHVLLGNSL
jgi:hypothetical protein